MLQKTNHFFLLILFSTILPDLHDKHIYSEKRRDCQILYNFSSSNPRSHLSLTCILGDLVTRGQLYIQLQTESIVSRRRTVIQSLRPHLKGRIWPHSLSSVYVNVSWGTLKCLKIAKSADILKWHQTSWPSRFAWNSQKKKNPTQSILF